MTTKEKNQNSHTACWLTILGLLALVVLYSMLAYFGQRSATVQKQEAKDLDHEPKTAHEGNGDRDLKRRKPSPEVNELS